MLPPLEELVMKIKGVDRFREKIPMLSGRRIFLLPLYVFSILLLGISIIAWFHTLPRRLMASEVSPILLSLLPLAGELMIGVAGFGLVYQMWHWRDRLRARYGRLSYQKVFLVGFAGLSLIFSYLISLYLPFWSLSTAFWMESPLRFLSIPIEGYLGPLAMPVLWLRKTLSALALLSGVLLIIRSLQTFGADYLSVLYLYFPEESTVQDHELYSVLRHPTYTGWLLIGLGGALYTFTPHSIVLYLLILGGVYGHARFVEEKELIARFGQSYQEYMDEVPAFMPKARDLGVLLRFLTRGG